MTAEEKII